MSQVINVYLPAAHAKDGPDANKPRLLFALPYQEHHIEEADVVDGVLLIVEEHAREVLCQLIVILELVSDRVQQWAGWPHVANGTP